MHRKHRSAGFTLTEVIVGLSVIAIIAAIVFTLQGPVRENARQIKCMNNLRQLYVALQHYAEDFPPPSLGMGIPRVPMIGGKGWKGSFWQAYVGGRQIRTCPNFPYPERILPENPIPPYPPYPLGTTYEGPPDIADFLKRDTWPYSARYEHLIKKILTRGNEFPLFSCFVHDETYYLPREEHIDPRIAGVYTMEIRLDGSVWRGRVFDRPRGYDIIRYGVGPPEFFN
ncbi:MAG: type II secretion system protein [Candidatus Caldarchaeum sp.]